MNRLIIMILILGVIYKLSMISNGNFLFNMDNARDMVDVREMVVLGKLRLIGPTSAIEGLYNGPFWYYLLAIPFILSGGDPYASILMEIFLWAIGGFFLLKLVSGWHRWLILPAGLIWIASDYIGLTTQYAFNPNPIPLLTPLFIYLLYRYLQEAKLVFIASAFFLGGLFFNFEMNFGIFIPPIIFLAVLLTNKSFLKTKGFWFGFLFYLAGLLPQILFELRHGFFMANSVINYLRNTNVNNFNLILSIRSLFESFFSVFSAALMNHRSFTLLILIFLIPLVTHAFKKKEILVIISSVYIILPFSFYLFLPVAINPWHLGGEAAALIILVAFLIKTFWQISFKGKLAAAITAVFLLIYSLTNISNFLFKDRFRENNDPSLYKNEIAAIDYVYRHAKGQNFKVYTFLPSVYDYPYQYLFWWYGQKRYGYIPGEYVYSPRKPSYIPSQDKFQGRKDNFSGLVFLIKEPNRGLNYKSGWEADYRFMELIKSDKLGEIEIEIRREITTL